ncbi:hypothetical protein N2152v2_010345 [Parachlorella kessleri]
MSSLESPAGGSRSSLRLSPAKERKRGSGELVEFCAESFQGSKQYVRQEPAQDPCGHDLLVPLVQAPACDGSSPQPERSAPSPSTLLLDPPCPSPQLDGLAAVSSNSSYACSNGGGSQPGSAASHSSQGSITRAAGFPPAGHSGKDSSTSAAGSPLQPFRETPSAAPLAAAHGAVPDISPAALLLHPSAQHILRGSSDPLSTRGQAAPILRMTKLAAGLPGTIPVSQQQPGQRQQQLKSGWGRQAGVGLQPLEVPDDGGMIGASRSAVDEAEFITPVSLCLTPIRTRARARRESQEAEDPSPVVYVERLAPPQDSCFPKVLPSMRATINILASSTSSARIAPPPGAYNPYERLALGAGGGGYQGGSSYGFSYGGAPSGPTTSSSTSSSFWASHRPQHSQQGMSQQRGAAAAQAAAAEDGWWGRPAAATAVGPQAAAYGARGSSTAGEADADEVEHIVMVPGGVRRKPAQQQQREEDHEVEHVVMVPGMRRRAPAGQLPAAAEQPALAAAAALGTGDDMGVPVLSPTTQEAADLGPVAEVGCARPAAAAEKAVIAASSVAVAPITPIADQGTLALEIQSTACDQGSHKLLTQVLKAVMVAGVAFAAAAASQESS